MKSIKILLGVMLAFGMVAFSGCKKKEAAGEVAAPMVIEGVNVDIPKLMQSVTAAKNTGARDNVAKAMISLRYGMYEKAMTDLNKVASSSDLTDEQKKIAADVVEQLKQVVAKAGPTRK